MSPVPKPRSRMPWLFWLSAALALLPSALRAGDATIGHAIDAAITPEAGYIQASDTLTLPEGQSQLLFWLHEGLNPRVDGDALLERIGRDGYLERFRVTSTTSNQVRLRYAGRIRHDMQTVSEGMGRSREQSIGTIEPDGVFLSGASGWYPTVPDRLLHFSLTLQLPPGWLAVSQGAGPAMDKIDRGLRVGWREDQPQDEIYVSAARFQLYRQPTPYGEAQAYLRQPDDALAGRYQAATAKYLERYSKLIGAYPYAKFALVENFWETGYGMPSFTLLGPRVLRLPFIIDSSYPHEILHNWWGNSVYVDYASGNWSEGLTAYLADHLNQEIAGRGAEYRRDQLKAYADYVRDDKDFPLIQFHGRHGSASQAIGYGKMLMTTHMLRTLIGDDRFRHGLQRFYADNRFHVADFDDLRHAFERSSDRDLKPFFDDWITRTGAPALRLSDVRVASLGNGRYRVSGRVDQVQPEPPYSMVVPVVLHAEQDAPQRVLARFVGREARFEADLAGAPVRVAVDPAFDCFRTLLPGESPVALSTLFGAEAGLILVPAAGPPALRQAYRALAEAWQQGHPGWRIETDDGLKALPADRPVWLLGWQNRFVDVLGRTGNAFSIDQSQRTVTISGTAYRDRSLALAAEHGGQALGWVAAAEADALPGLARKLPHYGKYGYLVFSGSAPTNELKGQWPVSDSALMHWFTDQRPALTLPPRPLLIETGGQ
jgi:aminopeptidase N